MGVHLEYNIGHFDGVALDLTEVKFSDPNEENSEDVMDGWYIPKKPLIMTCSMCHKEKEVYVIRGKQLIRGTVDLPTQSKKGSGIYHRTFFVFCESCAAIRRI